MEVEELRTQIAKLHHQVVSLKVAHCISLQFSLISCCFSLVILLLKLRCVPLCISLDSLSLFALYSFISDPSLLCYPSPFLFYILLCFFFVSSCFHLGEEGIHTEELETDLGNIFVLLNKSFDDDVI